MITNYFAYCSLSVFWNWTTRAA